MQFYFGFGVVFVALLACSEVSGLFWQDLRVTWRMKSTDPGAFALMPFTMKMAKDEGWEPKSDCYNGGRFNGFRFVANQDPRLSLLFDQNGYIAGIQMNLLVSELKSKNNSYKFDEVPAYVRNEFAGQDVYTLTAYFVDPDIICTGGRGFFQVWQYGLGKDLYFQNGPTSADYVLVPKKRDDNVPLGWSASACFQGMGYHSFFGLDTLTPTNCDYIFPYVLLFDSDHGELKGFAYTAVGVSSSPRFEVPSRASIVVTIGKDVPQCLLDVPQTAGLIQMHVFFVESPWEFTCPA